VIPSTLVLVLCLFFRSACCSMVVFSVLGVLLFTLSYMLLLLAVITYFCVSGMVFFFLCLWVSTHWFSFFVLSVLVNFYLQSAYT